MTVAKQNETNSRALVIQCFPKNDAESEIVNQVLGQAYLALSQRFLSPTWRGNKITVPECALSMKRVVSAEFMGIELMLTEHGIEVER